MKRTPGKGPGQDVGTTPWLGSSAPCGAVPFPSCFPSRGGGARQGRGGGGVPLARPWELVVRVGQHPPIFQHFNSSPTWGALS